MEENISKNFVIGIGGTGMRCLESFTHMCAMGLFDQKEFNVLTLDTDYLNGNKQRTESLIELYNQIKKTDQEASGFANNDTFFSAKINLFKCVADYSGGDGSPGSDFETIAKLENNPDAQILADLFLSKRVQGFDLAHGYRAQTHLGSYLMYHALLEIAARLGKGTNIKEQDKDFGRFLDLLMRAGENARVFVFGSVFGGTGASSIPVIPKALQDAMRRKSENSAIHPDTVYGATLLTEYFEFKPPTEDEKKEKKDGIIADSSFFTLNSQAALSFYENDITVKKSYKKMYHVGWPVDPIDYSKDKNEAKTNTGGDTQKNGCHLVDFLCATAAWDFFNTAKDGFKADEAVVYYKSFKLNNNILDIDHNDILGDGNNAKLFVKKFNSFYRFMHMVLSVGMGASGENNGVKAFQVRLNKNNIKDYDTLSTEFMADLNKFMRMFGYSINPNNNKFNSGWIYQIKNSFEGKFVLENSSFTTEIKELGSKFNFGKLYSDDHEFNWKDGSLIGSNDGADWADEVVKKLLEVKPSTNAQILNNKKEEFIAHIYNALNSIKTN